MKGQSTILLVFCAVCGTLSKPPPTFLEYKDSLGQYSFGYSAPGSARSEVRSLDGSTRGSYSYVDDAGVIQSAQYTADGKNGFRLVATNLPQAPNPVVDTPEVVAARLDHLKAHELAAQSAGEISDDAIQRETAIVKKDAVVVEHSENSVERANDDRVSEKSANSELNSGAMSEAPMEIQSKMSDEEKKPVVMETDVESPMKAAEKTAEAEQMFEQALQSQPRSGIRSDVPVATTSFVIPGTVDIHTRIELDRSGASASRSSLQSLAQPTSQQTMPQATEIPASTMTPASTKSTSMSTGEEDGFPMKDMSLRVAPVQSSLAHYVQQPFSVPFLPGVIAPSNIVAVPYAVGGSQFYPHYNPYRYFPLGFL